MESLLANGMGTRRRKNEMVQSLVESINNDIQQINIGTFTQLINQLNYVNMEQQTKQV